MLIKKIQILNLMYSNGTKFMQNIRYDTAGGGNTLIRIGNSNGKGVTIQTVSGIYMRGRDLNWDKEKGKDRTRNFTDLFDKPSPAVAITELSIKDHTYIVGYMAGSKIRDGEKKLDMTSFIGEYKPQLSLITGGADDPFDAFVNGFMTENAFIPMSEAKKYLSECQKSGLFKTFKFYNRNDYSRQNDYFNDLEKIGVNTDTWKNIVRPLVEKEANISKYFMGMKTEESFFRSFLFPIIESKLNKQADGADHIRELQKSVMKYGYNYKESIEKIKGRDALTHLIEDLHSVSDDIDKISEESDKKKQTASGIAGLKMRTQHLEKENGDLIRKIESQRKATEDELAQVTYEKLSLKYHKLNDKCSAEKQLKDQADAECKELKREDKKKRLNVSAYEIKKDMQRIREAEKGRNRCQANIEAVKQSDSEKNAEAKRNYLGWLMKTDHDQKLASAKNELDHLQEEKDCLENKEMEIENEKKESFDKVTEYKSQYSSAQTSCAMFEKKADCYAQRYPDNKIVPTFIMSYPTDREDEYVSKLINDLERKMADIKYSIKEAENNAEMADKQAEAEKDRIQNFRQDLRDAMSEKERISDILKTRSEAAELARCEAEAVSIYDRNALLNGLKAKINNNRNRTDRLAAEISNIDSQIEGISNGTFGMFPHDLKKKLEKYRIDVGADELTTGIGWLMNTNDEEERRRQLDRCPYLPYSVFLLSDRDAEKISTLDFYTDRPILFYNPHEAAERNSEMLNSGTGLYSYAKFDPALLTADGRGEAINRLENEKSMKKQKKTELEDISERCMKIQDRISCENEKYYVLTSESLPRAEKTIEDISEKIKNSEQHINELLYRVERLKVQKEELHEECSSVEDKYKNADERYRKLKEIEAENAEYEKSLEMKTTTERLLEKEKNHEKALSANLEKIRQQKKMFEMRIKSAEINADRIERNTLYDHFTQTECPDDSLKNIDPEKIEPTFNALSRRISKNSETLNLLREQLADYEKSIREAQQICQEKISEYEGSDWEADCVSEQEAIACRKRIRELTVLIGNKESEYRKANDKYLRLSGRTEEQIDKIHEQCGKAPAEKNMIRKINFTEAEKQCRNTIKELMNSKESVQNEANRCRRLFNKIDLFIEQIGDTKAVPDNRYENLEGCKINSEYQKLKDDWNALNGSIDNRRKKLIKKLEDLSRNYQESGNSSYFDQLKKCIEVEFPWKELYAHSKKAIDHAGGKLSSSEKALEELDGLKEIITDSIYEYIKKVYAEVDKVNSYSYITYGGKNQSMFNISQPHEPDNARNLISAYIDECAEGMETAESESKMEEYIESKITSLELYKQFIHHIENVRIKCFNVSNGKRENWKNVKFSGGEGSASAFAIVCAVLSYSRAEKGKRKSDTEWATFLLDNPFGENIDYSWTLIDIARENHIQLISFTAETEAKITYGYKSIYTTEMLDAKGNKEIMRESGHEVRDPKEMAQHFIHETIESPKA